MAEQSIHYRTHCLFGVVLSKGAIKSMASKDFENLMDLLFKKGQRIEGFTTHLNGDSTGQAHISFIDSADTFSSKEPDVVKYTLRVLGQISLCISRPGQVC